MNIGIDVDGVLVDLEKYQLKNGEKYFAKQAVNPKAYDVEQIFACTHEEREKFWHKYIWAYCMSEPAIDNAAQVISKLHDDGHKIIIITGRVHTTKNNITGKLFRTMLRYWLKKNHIVYDDIVFCLEKESSREKLNACIDKQVDIMIDDKPENLYALKDQVRVICYPAIWNKDVADTGFIKVNDWSDVYVQISNLNSL